MTKNPPKLQIAEKFDYRSLLGNPAWERLHPAIRRRFSSATSKKSVTYKGVMETVYLSRAGALLAQLCRVIGTPLALYNGQDIPMEVKVYPDENLNGMAWDRFYYYSDKPVNRVKSIKCILANEGLVEVVGFGFGMHLKIFEKNSALYFESTRFFWQFKNVRVYIPDILTPGKTTVWQAAVSEYKFRFSLKVIHPLLGKVFWQTGIFDDPIPQGI
ncbi:MAG: DUF4166 domain-containing protein [Cellvibrionaceae bacterium]